MKLRVMAATLAALTLTAGIASAQNKPATAPAKPATNGSAALPIVNKTHASYAFGWQLGQQLSQSGEPVDLAAVVRGVQDAYGKKQAAYTEAQLGQAYGGFQKHVEKKAQDAMRKALADNKTHATEFLAKYKAQQGVVTLPNGVMYRVAKAGTGAKPTATSEVQIAFRSFLAAVGVPLSGLQTPPPFKVSDTPIQALKDTIPLMQQGAVWEVVIPADKGLAGGQNGQLADQTIALQVELGAIK